MSHEIGHKASKTFRINHKSVMFFDKVSWTEYPADIYYVGEWNQKCPLQLVSIHSVAMQISRDFTADVEFEATLKEPTDEYGSRKKGKCIELRVMNYRPVLRAMMESYLKQLPEEIPKMYGSMRLGDAPNGRY